MEAWGEQVVVVRDIDKERGPKKSTKAHCNVDKIHKLYMKLDVGIERCSFISARGGLRRFAMLCCLLASVYDR